MKTSLMRYCAILCVLLVFGVAMIEAQSTDINRFEGFVGYSPMHLDSGFDPSDFDPEFADEFSKYVGAHGFNASVTGNFSRYVGAKFDFSTHSKSENFEFDGDSFNEKYRVNQFLGGIQVKDNQREDSPRIKPFAHVLAGIARQSNTLSGSGVLAFTGQNEIKVTSTEFAMAVGGGIDIRASKNIDIRVFQVDYNPIFNRDQDVLDFTVPGTTQHNARFSFGIVFH